MITMTMIIMTFDKYRCGCIKVHEATCNSPSMVYVDNQDYDDDEDDEDEDDEDDEYDNGDHNDS